MPTEATGRPWSHQALVVLRMALPDPAPEALERVARVARTLGAGEVLAVWSAGDWPVDDLAAMDGRLRVAGCRFAPGDRETFVWVAPPEPSPIAPGAVDVRGLAPPLPLVVTALAVAGLPPGGSVAVTGAGRSPLLADLLAGRADVSEAPPAGDGAPVMRITRR